MPVGSKSAGSPVAAAPPLPRTDSASSATGSAPLRIQPQLHPQPTPAYPTAFDRPPTGRVSIPGQSPASPTDGPSHSAGGIITRDYSQIPPRPKPGRKPATDAPSSKRKEQNREAQRAYRARKAQQCDELEDELSKRTKEWTEKESAWQRKFDEQERAQIQSDANHRAYAASLERQVSDEKTRASRLEEEIHRLNRELGAARAHRFSDSSVTSYPSHGSRNTWSQPITPPAQDALIKRPGIPSRAQSQEGRRLSQKTFNPECRKCENGGPCVCLSQGLQKSSLVDQAPKVEEPMEIDFTNMHSKKRDSATAGLDRPEGESCGFCTDKDNCVCAMESAREPELPKPQKTHEPGSCDRCVADPERARWCRMLALEVPQGPNAQSGTAVSSPREAPSPRPQMRNLPSIDETASMTCDEAYDEFRKTPALNRRRDSLSFIRQLKARPAHRDSTTSAFEVDMASVLTAMKGAGRNSWDGGKPVHHAPQ